MENGRIVENYIDQTKEKYDLDDDVYGNILVALTECVNNAIVHGNKEDKTKDVTIGIDIKDHEISFTIEDEGEGFEYEELPDPTAPENIDKLGGRGVFLMKHLADEVKYYEPGNKVEITFYI